MIGGYVLRSEEAEVAFQFFWRDGMVSKNEIEMDGQIMVNVIEACIHLGKIISIERLVHGFVIGRGFVL
ncbi:unnamed protein product [Camellia sinensis]